jgi:hypothetical protein
MPKSLRVNERTSGLPDHLILFVDDIELFFHELSCQKSKVKSHDIDF